MMRLFALSRRRRPGPVKAGPVPATPSCEYTVRLPVARSTATSPGRPWSETMARLLASSIIAVLAQRLVRMICPECRESYVPEDESLAEIGINRRDIPDGKLFRGAGCSECMTIGYMGRTGLYEFFPVTEEIRAMIMEQKSAGDIKRIAIQRNLKTLRMDGGKKVILGKTTIEEALRVTQIDM